MAQLLPLVTLLDGITADEDGASFALVVPGTGRHNALYSAYVRSTDFGGGTVTIQVSSDGTNWFTARTRNDNQAIFTVADHMVLQIQSANVRARLVGAVGPAALTVELI